jgi:perosamine synthetase
MSTVSGRRSRRSTFLPFHLPSIGDEEVEAVVAVLRSGWLTSGREVQRFQAEFAEAVGARHAIALNSCTAALHLALEASGVGPGDEVLVPTMTFAATAEVVCYLGAVPVLVDCDPVHLNVDPADVERRLTPRSRAILPVHFGGQPCPMDPILEIARASSLAVIDDAAHSFPASYRGRAVGTLADATCFSFYATKTITTGEGGMVTTDDDRLAERVRLMSLHGISKDAWKRYTPGGTWRYDILEAGFKYNLTDVAAALGVVQLGRHRELFRERVRLMERYRAGLAGVAALHLPSGAPDVEHAWHLFVVLLELDRLTIDRDRFIELLTEANIGTSVHFRPLHLHSLYRERFGYRPEDLPVATALFERNLSLPMYPGMTDQDVDDVIDAVTRIAEAHAR